MSNFPSITRIIPGIKSGDEHSWAKFVRLFEPGLMGRARQLLKCSGLQRRVDPEDLVNQVFERTWENRARLRTESTSGVAAFLLTTLQNRFIDLCRPANKEETQPTWFALEDSQTSPSKRYMMREQEADLHAGLVQLPENQRMVVVMRHFDGLKFREIAEQMGIKTGAAAGLARNGIKSLAEILRGAGDTSFNQHQSDPR